MRTIILAIISVALLQMSFQVYMALDRSDAEYRAMNVPEAVRQISKTDMSVAELPESEVLIRTMDVIHHRKPTSLQATHTHFVEGPLTARFRRETPGRKATRDVKATVAKTSPAVEVRRAIPQPVPVMRRDGPPPEDKSFFAKALPVIKKPYDWIKGIASKLK